jgi:hypothetical protein
MVSGVIEKAQKTARKFTTTTTLETKLIRASSS